MVCLDVMKPPVSFQIYCKKLITRKDETLYETLGSRHMPSLQMSHRG